MSWLRAVFPEDSAVSLKDGDVAVTRSMSFGNVHAEVRV